MHAYLDLNIFDRIEKKNFLKDGDQLIYSELEDLIINEKLIVPYSNAHLNDLYRGYIKNSNYIEGHLINIERLTKNLCLCQYWGDNEVTWHYRDIKEFFREKEDDLELNTESFDHMFSDLEVPNPYLLYKAVPLPKNWKQGYKDPMFGIMFPRAKVHNTLYSLADDILGFHNKLKSDYSLYKTFKSYLIKNLNKLQSNRELLKSFGTDLHELPKHLDVFEISNRYSPKNKTSENVQFQKIVETFCKYDLKGYKTDGNFNNMFDDSLHTFYGAQCDIFITNDDRCKYKAEKTYERLKISTKVYKANEIINIKKQPMTLVNRK